MSPSQEGRCYGCRQAGTRPQYVERVPSVVFYPPIGMPGRPTIEGHRLSAEHMCARVLVDGFEGVLDDYGLTRPELLVACWWAGMYGPRKWRKRWGEWAAMAGHHLWYSCVNVPAPPVEQE